MHYFKRNIGDYAKKAGKLSMLQHGAYTLLMDACYDRERFPTLEDAIDWCWASTDDEISAVKFVLGKFFELVDGKYTQTRIQDEIDDFHGKSAVNRRIALEREENRRNSARNVIEKARNVDVLSPDKHEAPPNQEPLTINQEPRTKETSVASAPAAKAAKVEYTAEFEVVWAEYPKRHGSNSKHDAFKAWCARRKEKVAPELMLDGVRRYARFLKAAGKLGTEFVMQAQRFFGPARPYAEEWVAKPPAGKIVTDTSQYNYQASDDHRF